MNNLLLVELPSLLIGLTFVILLSLGTIALIKHSQKQETETKAETAERELIGQLILSKRRILEYHKTYAASLPKHPTKQQMELLNDTTYILHLIQLEINQYFERHPPKPITDTQITFNDPSLP